VDFQTFKAGRRALVLARRWKSAQVGVEVLRSLREAADAADCQDAIHVSLGDLSEAAATYAQRERVQVWGASELAALRVLA
jgi:restriction system protein